MANQHRRRSRVCENELQIFTTMLRHPTYYHAVKIIESFNLNIPKTIQLPDERLHYPRDIDILLGNFAW